MAGSYQVHITIPYFTGLPEDVITNVWSFAYTGGTPSTTQWNNLRTAFDDFYTTVYTIGGGADLVAPWVDISAVSMKGYLLSDPTPRVPKYMSTFAITATPPSDSETLPEVALCLSFQGDPVAGVPQARRRGRLFLGGFAGGIDPGDASSFPNIGSTVRSGICSAADTFANAVPAQQFFWSVWSRTNANMVPITNGWVDDAPDIQRRRGTAPSVRDTFTV